MLADSIVALEGGSYTMSTDDTFIKQQWQDQEALHRFRKYVIIRICQQLYLSLIHI